MPGRRVSGATKFTSSATCCWWTILFCSLDQWARATRGRVGPYRGEKNWRRSGHIVRAGRAQAKEDEQMGAKVMLRARRLDERTHTHQPTGCARWMRKCVTRARRPHDRHQCVTQSGSSARAHTHTPQASGAASQAPGGAHRRRQQLAAAAGRGRGAATHTGEKVV